MRDKAYFWNALHVASSRPCLRYAEGFALSLFGWEHHAWVVDHQGHAIDVTWVRARKAVHRSRIPQPHRGCGSKGELPGLGRPRVQVQQRRSALMAATREHETRRAQSRHRRQRPTDALTATRVQPEWSMTWENPGCSRQRSVLLSYESPFRKAIASAHPRRCRFPVVGNRQERPKVISNSESEAFAERRTVAAGRGCASPCRPERLPRAIEPSV